MKTPLSSETVHASSVAIAGRAVLIGGRSGRGKSDLAVRLIDRGAALISDDYTLVRRVGDGKLQASAPDTIAGKIELRGVGIIELAAERNVPVALFVDLDLDPARLPDTAETRRIAGVDLPVIGVHAHEASAPIKVKAALKLFGLEG